MAMNLPIDFIKPEFSWHGHTLRGINYPEVIEI